MAIFIEGMSHRIFTRILNKVHDYAFPIYFGPYREHWHAGKEHYDYRHSNQKKENRHNYTSETQKVRYTIPNKNRFLLYGRPFKSFREMGSYMCEYFQIQALHRIVSKLAYPSVWRFCISHHGIWY